MDYDYTKWINEPHELCQMAKADLDKIYKDSCVKAIQDIDKANRKRAELSKKADFLAARLMAAYDGDARDEVNDLLEQIAKNVRG